MTTQFANASYQEIIDLSTQPEAVSVIGIHTPCSSTPVNMLHGFWEQFRQFRYDGCSISLVPSASLPADISQVSYEAGEAPIDPRDILNPVMFHGCHGEDMGSIINSFIGDTASSNGSGWDREYSDSVNLLHRDGVDTNPLGSGIPSPLESLYYRALTDKSWKKAHPQRGFRKAGLRPLVYNVVTNTPFGAVSPGSDTGYYGPEGYATIADYVPGDTPTTTDAHPDVGEAGLAGQDAISSPLSFRNRGALPYLQDGTIGIQGSKGATMFGTNKLVPLGWRDTRSVLPTGGSGNVLYSGTYEDGGEFEQAAENQALIDAYSDPSLNVYHTVDKLFMGLILLPPSYKARQYMRLIINHRFSFRRFRGASMDTSTPRSVGYAQGYHNLL